MATMMMASRDDAIVGRGGDQATSHVAVHGAGRSRAYSESPPASPFLRLPMHRTRTPILQSLPVPMVGASERRPVGCIDADPIHLPPSRVDDEPLSPPGVSDGTSADHLTSDPSDGTRGYTARRPLPLVCLNGETGFVLSHIAPAPGSATVLPRSPNRIPRIPRHDQADRHSTPEPSPILRAGTPRSSLSLGQGQVLLLQPIEDADGTAAPRTPRTPATVPLVSRPRSSFSMPSRCAAEMRDGLDLPSLPMTPLPPFDLTDLLGFLHTPLPRGHQLRCTLHRDRSSSFASRFYPSYCLSIEATGDTYPHTTSPRMLLYSQKKSASRYLIRTVDDSAMEGVVLPKIKETDPACLGVLRTNFVGHRYSFTGRMAQVQAQRALARRFGSPLTSWSSSGPPTPAPPHSPSLSSPSPASSLPASPALGSMSSSSSTPPDLEIDYELKIFGSQPRHMSVTLPGVRATDESERVPPSPALLLPSAALSPGGQPSPSPRSSLGRRSFSIMPESFVPPHTPALAPIILHTNQPRFNSSLNCNTLNFAGRAPVASEKNFQLIEAHSSCNVTTPTDVSSSPSSAAGAVRSSSADPASVVLQLGKKGAHDFNVDMRWPLTPVQAFAIVLSMFDFKIAVD